MWWWRHYFGLDTLTLHSTHWSTLISIEISAKLSKIPWNASFLVQFVRRIPRICIMYSDSGHASFSTWILSLFDPDLLRAGGSLAIVLVPILYPKLEVFVGISDGSISGDIYGTRTVAGDDFGTRARKLRMLSLSISYLILLTLMIILAQL